MTGHFKYIIVWSPAAQAEAAILVPEFLSHDQCVDPKKNKILAAGFCTINQNSVIAHGHSESLGIGSRAQDERVIWETLAMSGAMNVASVQV